MKALTILLAAAFLLPATSTLRADDKAKDPSYQFEFKITKQRTSRDKKGSSSNNTTSEQWNYKVEVENRSLQNVGELDVRYTLYISTETRSGGSRRETTRVVSGDADLDPIARGNRSVFESKTASLKQSEKTERKQSKNKRGGNNKNKNKKTQIKVTEVREKLDGIHVQLFLDGKRVAEYVVGDAAKRAAAKRKKK